MLSNDVISHQTIDYITQLLLVNIQEQISMIHGLG